MKSKKEIKKKTTAPKEKSTRQGRPPTRGAVATSRIDVKVTPDEMTRYSAALCDGETLSGVVRGLLDAWATRRAKS